MSDDHVPKVPAELREVESVDDAALENIWIADQPVGLLLKSLGARVAELETVVEELQAADEDGDEVAPKP